MGCFQLFHTDNFKHKRKLRYEPFIAGKIRRRGKGKGVSFWFRRKFKRIKRLPFEVIHLSIGRLGANFVGRRTKPFGNHNPINKPQRKNNMALYKYKSYEEYKSIQIKTNKRKLHHCWVRESDIKFLADYIKTNSKNYCSGICHGTRGGYEQKWFRKYLDIDVIGTEISPTATKFPYTIQWDFHDIKNEWIDNIDFIYSNAFDHTFDPVLCLKQWMKCVKKEGICIMEWGGQHMVHSRATDPYKASRKGLEELIDDCGFHVKEIISTPDKKRHSVKMPGGRIFYIIIH